MDIITMLEIKVILDKTAPAQYLTARGIQCELTDKLVMCATDDGVVCGYGVISMESEYATIQEICCEKDVDFIMGKSLLNLIDNAGIQIVYCKNEQLKPLLLRLKFSDINNDGVYSLDLNGYFAPGC